MEVLNSTLSTQQAASYLGIAEITLRNSRVSGFLGKSTAPKFRKIGSKVIYFQSDLDDWINDLPVYTNTAQVEMGVEA